MKILYFTNSRIPTEMAYGIQIFKTCQALAKAGVDLELILPTRKNKPFKGINSFDYYQVKQNFKIKKIWSYDPNFLMHLKDGIYIKFQLVFFIVSLFFYLISRRGRLEEQDIFYTRDEYLLKLLQKFCNKTVWEAHTLPKNKLKYLNAWQKCYKIITISQGLKNELIKLGIDENKILVAHDGVDLMNYELRIKNNELRKKLNLLEDKKIIMYTGHLYDWKGVNVLLDAAQNFQFPRLPKPGTGGQANNNFLFVFIGGTKIDIKNFKEKAKNIKNVLILGYKPPAEIPNYLKLADILILPNSAQDEQSKWTSPLKLFEYMASKKPIVASNLLSICEILNENNSVLVKPDNPEELTNGIKKILSNSELAEKISKQAFHDVQNYTWQKRAEKIYTSLSRA